MLQHQDMRQSVISFCLLCSILVSCKSQPTSNIDSYSIKESHTTEIQREQIQKKLNMVLNNSSSVEELKTATFPYLGVLYECATDKDIEKRLYSELCVNVFASNIIRKEQELKNKGLLDDEDAFLEIKEALFSIDNHWDCNNDNGTVVIHHDRLVDWNDDGYLFFSISVWQKPEAEPIVLIQFPQDAKGAPTASFSDFVDGKEDLDNQIHYTLPSWNDRTDSYYYRDNRLTSMGRDFLDLMLSNEYMYLFYRTNSERARQYDGIEMTKIPLAPFQVLYRDYQIKNNK